MCAHMHVPGMYSILARICLISNEMNVKVLFIFMVSAMQEIEK